MLNQRLLESYIQNFYGYGSWDAPLMFIGPEEGGGAEEGALQAKLDAYSEFNLDELLDLKQFHLKLTKNDQQWFLNGGKFQSTWGRLCRVALAFGSPETTSEITPEDVVQYQMDRLGSVEAAETCVIEVSSLPCPNAGAWKYAEFSDLPYLKSRSLFEDYFERNVRPKRMERMKAALSAPCAIGRRIVVVYGRRQSSARLVQELTAKSRYDQQVLVGKAHIDVYVQDAFALLWIDHPTSARTHTYFERVGIEAARLARQ